MAKGRYSKSSDCECSDKMCPAHSGKSSCSKKARVRMRRVDMDDRSGVLFCLACADDAANSGVFGPPKPPHWR
jgi:hypothetical protein